MDELEKALKEVAAKINNSDRGDHAIKELSEAVLSLANAMLLLQQAKRLKQE